MTGKVENTSRNKPEIRSVTSIRGRPSTASAITSKPATRSEVLSHTGAMPIRCSAMANSSPAVRMVAEPQRSSMTWRG